DPPAVEEAPLVAEELAFAFRGMLELHTKHYQLSLEEAVERATGPAPEYDERVLHGPPDEVSWFGLDSVAQHDPGRARERWEEVKRAARQELRTGYRAARALERPGEGPWSRARYLALRAELTEAWRPRDALEQQLVDQLAQWQSLLFVWQEALAA